MHVIKDENFIKEILQYRLNFNCEDCRYYEEKRDFCSMLYPTDHHKKSFLENTKINDRIYFCKMFEVK